MPRSNVPGVWDHAETGGWSDRQLHASDERTGPDQAPYHNRQPVILERAQWGDWLDVTNDIAPAFRGSPAGTLAVERFVDAPAVPQLF